MKIIIDIGLWIVFVVGAVCISSFIWFLLTMLKDFIVGAIGKCSKKTFRIDYVELLNGNIENKSCFGDSFVRTMTGGQKYMIVRASNDESAMYKFYRRLKRVYGMRNPKYAILSVIKEYEIK